jgi:hypothetical protein
MPDAIRQLYAAHDGYVSDKWEQYLSVYDDCFLSYKDKAIHLLEIGIQNGGSLEIWGKYFSNARHIVGCDIDTNCQALEFTDRRIRTVIGNINSQSTLAHVKAIAPSFDIIIDDGSHKSGDIINTFKNLYSHLSPGGMYVIEDLHCSYWSKWGGGLWKSASAMEFFKDLTDVLNQQSWGIKKTNRVNIRRFRSGPKINAAELSDISSICFYNSMCVVKKSFSPNTIGGRVVAGITAMVQKRLPAPGSALPSPAQPKNTKRLKST